MRRAASWIVAVIVGAGAVAGLIAVFQARDDSTLDQPAQRAPGERRTTDLEELERAARAGNVVVLYREGPAPRLGEDTPELRAAGQAVIAKRVTGLDSPYLAVSARRQQAAGRPAELQPFVDYWLGGR